MALLTVGKTGRRDPKSLSRRLPWTVGKLQGAVWMRWWISESLMSKNHYDSYFSHRQACSLHLAAPELCPK